MDQWVEELTRHRGQEEPIMFDLVFTKKLESHPIIKAQWGIARMGNANKR